MKSCTSFIARVRLRLRLAWAAAALQRAGPWVLAIAVAVLLTGWLLPWSGTGAVALLAILIGAAVIVAGAFAVRISPLAAARAADRTLQTGSVLATALELNGSELQAAGASAGEASGLLARRVIERAEAVAGTANARASVPIRCEKRSLAAGAALGAAALALAFGPNPQDVARANRARDRAALVAAAAPLRTRGLAAVKQAQTPAQRRTAQRLLTEATALTRARNLKVARQRLERSATGLRAQLDPTTLATKAASVGLERSLDVRPLTDFETAASGTERDAAQQFADAARAASGLNAPQRQALAGRLEAMAAAQRAGDPKLAAALERAAQFLQAGDAAAAAKALDEASAAQSAAAGSTADAGAVANAADALDRADEAIQQAQGQSTGAAEGQGVHGQGTGQGAAPAASKGRGGGLSREVAPNGQNGGGQNGTVAGAKGGSGASGTGGRGKIGASGLAKSLRNTPAKSGGAQFAENAADKVNASGKQNEGPTRNVGKVNGPTRAGVATVALAQALPGYQAAASKAAGALDVPASQRAIVEAYFNGLAEARAAQDGQ